MLGLDPLWDMRINDSAGWKRAIKECEEAETLRWWFANHHINGRTYRDVWLMSAQTVTDRESDPEATSRQGGE